MDSSRFSVKMTALTFFSLGDCMSGRLPRERFRWVVVAVLAVFGASFAVPVSAASTGLSLAPAHGYSGNWPLTVAHSQRSNGAYCLTLTDDGSLGWPHSGEASVTGVGGKLPYGTFQVIDHLLIVTIQQPGGSQNAGLVFIGTVDSGAIGKGTYDQVYGGEEFDSGTLTFGANGGC
jgi:hypothetical protein